MEFLFEKKGTIDAHTQATNNPHNVTKGQVGLANVANALQVINGGNAPRIVRDVLSNRPAADGTQGIYIAEDAGQRRVYVDIGSWIEVGRDPANIGAGDLGFDPATQAELDAHTGDTTNPHAVTKNQVGLGSVIDALQVVNGGGVDNISAGTLADRPAAGTADRYYIATDTFQIFRDTGSSWNEIGGPGGPLGKDDLAASGGTVPEADQAATIIGPWDFSQEDSIRIRSNIGTGDMAGTTAPTDGILARNARSGGSDQLLFSQGSTVAAKTYRKIVHSGPDAGDWALQQNLDAPQLLENGQRVGPITSGTWTPTITGTSTAGTQSYTTQDGTFERRGDVITAYAEIALSALDASAAGTAVIKGWPVTPKKRILPVIGFMDNFAEPTSIRQWVLLSLTSGSTSVAIRVVDTSGNDSAPDIQTILTSTSRIFIAATYEV